MPPRKSPAQIQAELRRIQQRPRQALNDYNRKVDAYNRSLRKAVTEHNAGVRRVNQSIDRYNSAAKAHNSKVRANRDRLRRELERLSASTRSSTTSSYRTSVTRLTTSFDFLERRATDEGWSDSEIFALTSGEAANSVAALNALAGVDVARSEPHEEDELRSSRIEGELVAMDEDLDRRWRGALFALHPANPDAARHFCTSSREMLADVLEAVAPASLVEAGDPACDRTPQGSVSRRARIQYCLRRGGLEHDALEAFVDDDIDNVLALFAEFNSGTHGAAGKFSIGQLRTLKTRVEDAVLFVLRIAGVI